MIHIRYTPSNKTPEETIGNVKKHISYFPHYNSQCCGEKSGRKYLGTDVTIQNMYQLYIDDRNNKKNAPKLIPKKWLYSDILNKEFRLLFKASEIDTCDTCDLLYSKHKKQSN